MIIIDYNKLLKKYERMILGYAKRIDYLDYDDSAQEIRIYVFQKIGKFDPFKTTLTYYMNLLVLTAFRKIIYDKEKQHEFEDSFRNIQGDVPSVFVSDNYDEIVSKVVVNLKNETQMVIFYAILYNKGANNYSQIAKFLNMSYGGFLYHIKEVRKIVRVIANEYNLL